MQQYYSSGKLLITAEYVVLEGATALAIPTKLGQSMTVEYNDSKYLKWICKDFKKKLWYEGYFTKNNENKFHIHDQKTDEINTQIISILNNIYELNPSVLDGKNGLTFTHHLEFARDWGLGSSSTLINNLAQWGEINPYTLLKNSFGGSGYDIACAQANGPLSYQIKENKPQVKSVNFNPIFKDQLFFIHLNKKQNSREGIAQYQNLKKDKTAFISEINDITKKIIECQSLDEFEILLNAHESLIGDMLDLPPIKKRLFKDYPNTVKSLGAWGGDFVLATGGPELKSYFSAKGYTTIFSYTDLIK